MRSAWKSPRRAGWAWFAAGGAAVAGVYCRLPATWQSPVYDVVGLAACAAIITGVVVHRPARPAPWLLIALGVLLWVAGDVAYTVLEHTTAEVPFPSVADALYLSGYPVIVAAVLLVIRRSRGRDLPAWQDAGMWAVGVVVLSWEGLLKPTISASGATVLARAVAISCPALDLLLLLLVVRLARGAGAPPVARALAAVLGCYLLADAGYAWQVLLGDYVSGSPIDLGWIVSYVGLGALGLHPRMVEFTEPVTVDVRTGTRRGLLGLGLASLVAPLLLIVGELRGDAERADVLMLAVAGTVLCVLTTMRAVSLLQALQETTDTLLHRDAELRLQAASDALTGLPNRRTLHERLARELAQQRAFSVAILDLDEFKTVNDLRGHEVGDTLLLKIADRLITGLSPEDLVARLGGDEFAIVSSDTPAQMAARLLDCLPRSITVHGFDVPVRASAGIAGREHGVTASDMLRNADIAMYQAKAQGGDRALVHNPAMSIELFARHTTRDQLAVAVVSDEFVAYLQPVVDITSNRLHGFEALARWCQPGQGVQPPSQWMSVAEDSGLIVEIDLQVLRTAAEQMVDWSATVPGAAGLHLAVNTSGRSLQEPDVAERILNVLHDVGLDPRRVVLEVTEGIIIEEAVAARLQQLREAGVRVALDDFGTGWSSLTYLRRFPVDMLKIDRSFVTGINGGAGAEAVAAAVIQLATALELEVVAEGVETPEQVKILRRLGCHLAQGYLLGRPAPAGTLLPLVTAGRIPGGPPVVGLPVPAGAA